MSPVKVVQCAGVSSPHPPVCAAGGGVLPRLRRPRHGHAGAAQPRRVHGQLGRGLGVRAAGGR